MKFWTGVITEKTAEAKDFYTHLFGCHVLFENDWFVLLELGGAELGFMKPNLDFQAPIFHKPFQQSGGLWVVVDVDDVDAEYERIQRLGVPIELTIRTETWGDRHFVIKDPSGIAVDVVQRLEEEPA